MALSSSANFSANAVAERLGRHHGGAHDAGALVRQAIELLGDAADRIHAPAPRDEARGVLGEIGETEPFADLVDRRQPIRLWDEGVVHDFA